MPTTEIFFGLPLTPQLEKLLLDCPNPLISDNELYLQEVTCAHGHYLGKYLGNSIEKSQLDFFQNNILSLLKKIFPQQEFEKDSLFLFPLLKD